MKMLVFWLLILTAWSWSIAGQSGESRSDMRPREHASAGHASGSTDAYARPAPRLDEKGQPLPPPPPIVIRVSGHGAFPVSDKPLTEAVRLKAIRASKLDAYRNLAERVYGTRVSGSSTVRDFTLNEDGFATQVDTVVRGAREVSVIENAGRGYETVLELLLPGDFADCVTKVNFIRGGQDCFLPLPSSGGAQMRSQQSSSSSEMQRIYYLN